MEKEDSYYNPEKNPKAISIVQEEDGNWRGKINRKGIVLESRNNDPQTVLMELITHD